MQTTAPASTYVVEAALAANSIPVILVLSAVALYVFSSAKLANDSYYTKLGQKLLPALVAAAFPFLIIASLGPALLAVLGLALRAWNGELGKAFLITELSSGVFGLRLASVLVAYQAGSLEIRRLQLSIGSNQSISREQRERHAGPLLMAETQYLFYGIVAAALWYVHIQGHTSSLAAFVSWALLFILDDWSIIKDYLLARDAVPTKLHYYKVAGFNLLLVLSVGGIFLSAGVWLYAFFYAIPVICISPFWIRNYRALGVRISRADQAT